MTEAVFVHVTQENGELSFSLPALGYGESVNIDVAEWDKFKDVNGELPNAKNSYPKSAPSREYVFLNNAIYKKKQA
ncbi:hypothetical protein [Vibrio vulnificus]|uniref:hypothetical protein n=1 Tax=Vibrio vulnificus TaxID=672 RepID=UPI00102A9CDD|nr:hypothetical protein [Vibrio vulnificus]EGQ8024313.1 hypothetical protein [Vibrio vulnificus]RZQ72484.1 hypothetical protein D8T30_13610 [Vibrio vulnificus]RZQ95057.1 hypothetical protein D8T29_17370 [Vibrio vulnificus]RZR42880.1 hypothetical protein D8T35_22730 [Vibrio vulnificus]